MKQSRVPQREFHKRIEPWFEAEVMQMGPVHDHGGVHSSRRPDRVRGTLTYKPHNVPEVEILQCFQNFSALQLMAMVQKGQDCHWFSVNQMMGLVGWCWSAGPQGVGTKDSEPVHFYCQEFLSGYAPTASVPIQFEEVHMRFTNVAEWIRPFPPQSVWPTRRCDSKAACGVRSRNW